MPAWANEDILGAALEKQDEQQAAEIFGYCDSKVNMDEVMGRGRGKKRKRQQEEQLPKQKRKNT